MRSASAWTRLMLTCWVTCSCPACVIVGRQIGSGAAWRLPWDPSNIPRQIPEIAIKRNFTFFTFLYLCEFTVIFTLYLGVKNVKKHVKVYDLTIHMHASLLHLILLPRTHMAHPYNMYTQHNMRKQHWLRYMAAGQEITRRQASQASHLMNNCLLHELQQETFSMISQIYLHHGQW